MVKCSKVSRDQRGDGLTGYWPGRQKEEVFIPIEVSRPATPQVCADSRRSCPQPA